MDKDVKQLHNGEMLVPAMWSEVIWKELQDAQRIANMLARWHLDHPMPPPTRWQRLRWRLRELLDRVRDAWLVLTGRADIEG